MELRWAGGMAAGKIRGGCVAVKRGYIWDVVGVRPAFTQWWLYALVAGGRWNAADCPRRATSVIVQALVCLEAMRLRSSSGWMNGSTQ